MSMVGFSNDEHVPARSVREPERGREVVDQKDEAVRHGY